MQYNGKTISGFYILDWDNQNDPQEMLKDRKFYACPDRPELHMGASQMRDLINVVARVADRIGGDANRISWFAELTETPDQLHEILNGDQLTD